MAIFTPTKVKHHSHPPKTKKMNAFVNVAKPNRSPPDSFAVNRLAMDKPLVCLSTLENLTDHPDILALKRLAMESGKQSWQENPAGAYNSHSVTSS